MAGKQTQASGADPTPPHMHGINDMAKKRSLNKAIYWSEPSINGLEFLSASYTNHEFSPHTHDSYAFGMVESGALSFNYRSPSDAVSDGQTMIIHPGKVHTGQCVSDSGCSYRMVYVSPGIMHEKLKDHHPKHSADIHFKKQSNSDFTIARSILQVFRSFSDASSTLIEKESSLQILLEKLVLEYASEKFHTKQPKIEKAYVKKARQYFEDNYDKDVGLNEVAHEVNISPFHLLRMFKDDLGIPPHAYLTQVRIQKSKQYLAQGHTLSEVAQLTGYCDQSQFTKRFKQLVGTTPGVFQKNNRNFPQYGSVSSLYP